ncbi:MAG: hypothetical protein ACRD4J_07945 [Nitrososphaeraceae archaeon]
MPEFIWRRSCRRNMDLRMNRMVAIDLNPQEDIDGGSEFQVEAGVGGGAYLGYQASSVLSGNTNGL